MYGIRCATVGLVSVASVRHSFVEVSVDKPVCYPIMMSLKPSRTPNAAFPAAYDVAGFPLFVRLGVCNAIPYGRW